MATIDNRLPTEGTQIDIEDALRSIATAVGGITHPDAEDIVYDNTTSGLTATNVQDAIDEVEGDIPTALSELSDDSTHRLVTDSEKAEWNATTPTDTTDDEPYVLRQGKGNQVDFSLEGASVAWNQLVQNGNFASTDNWSKNNNAISFTVNNNIATVSISSSGDYRVQQVLPLIIDHKYLFVGECLSNVANSSPLIIYFGSASNHRAFIVTQANTWYKASAIFECISNAINQLRLRVDNTTNQYKNINLIDLTQLFGTTIADAIYSMEQATSGSGVAFFSKYFPKAYYAYDTGSIQSVCVSERRVYDSNNNLVANYPIPTTQLRGLFSLVNGKLKANGDVLRSDGNITRNYGYRAYQSGDESLANAITDGTNTVYKLTTPTSETTTPFQNPQRAYPDGTEEFVDGLTRDVIVPVGNNSTYTTSDVLASADDYTDGMGKMLLPISAVGTDESGRTTASRAYTTGEFFYKDGKMYKVLASIASGATFTVGTNISETTLFAELTALA